MKNYSSAPLPFQGQKRMMVKSIKKAVKGLPAETIFVDLFGGSGLVSHTVKSVKPNCRVIYNDFDNFQNRIENIPRTNALINDLREVVIDVEYKTKIGGILRDKVIETIEKHVNKGFDDFNTLSSNILYVMNYAANIDELKKSTLYNRLRKTPYDATGYLENVERVSMDYKDLYALYKDTSNVVFLCDPPYLSTDTKTYTDCYWRLTDYLNICESLKEHCYIYFTSNKSQIVELCEWMENQGVKSFFRGATIFERTTNKAAGWEYRDIMITRLKAV